MHGENTFRNHTCCGKKQAQRVNSENSGARVPFITGETGKDKWQISGLLLWIGATIMGSNSANGYCGWSLYNLGMRRPNLSEAGIAGLRIIIDLAEAFRFGGPLETVASPLHVRHISWHLTALSFGPLCTACQSKCCDTMVNNRYAVTSTMYENLKKWNNGAVDDNTLKQYLNWEMDAPNCLKLEMALFKVAESKTEWQKLRMDGLHLHQCDLPHSFMFHTNIYARIRRHQLHGRNTPPTPNRYPPRLISHKALVCCHALRGSRLQKAVFAFTMAFSDDYKPWILDTCMASGGFLKMALKHNSKAKAVAFSLSEKDGGYKCLLPNNSSVEKHFVDIIMLAADIRIATIPPDHPEVDKFLPRLLPTEKIFDFVLYDGQVLLVIC